MWRLLVLSLGLASCAGRAEPPLAPPPPPPEPPQVRSVTVTPAEVILAPGDSAQLTAVVDADAGLSREVRWTSSHPDAVTVSPAGVVTATPCGPDLLVAIEAVAVADTTKRGRGNAGRLGRATWPSIERLQDSASGRDIGLLEVRGTVAVTVSHPRPGCPFPADSLYLQVTGPAIGRAGAAIPVAGATNGPHILYWPSALQAGGAPAFPNGQYALGAVAVIGPSGPGVTAQVLPVRVVNP